MDEESSESPAWRYEPFANADEEDASAYRTGLPLFNDYQPAAHYNPRRETDHHERHEPPYAAFAQPRRVSAFESALRAARPPIERASSSTAAQSQQQQSSGLHLPRIGNTAPSSSGRYPGDGFDYRRPAGSSRDQEVGSVDLTREDDEEEEPNDAIDLSRIDDIIDLTADDSGYGASQDGSSGRQRHSNMERQDSNRARANNGAPRLPRGMDIIIDLDNGEEEWRMATPAPEPSSPDIEFISSRPIDPRRLPPPGNNSDGDEVEFLRENALPEAEIQRRRNRELDNVMDLFGTLNGRFTHLRAQVDRFHNQINRAAGRLQEPIAPTRSASRGHAPHIRLGAFVAPVMDFDAIGFELGPRTREAPAPPPTYEAPPKAPEGFTRSPEEEGELICPNCEEELCVGGDDIKRQVWIVKGCGHVYCGECTTNRAAKRSAKGKEKPANTEPFKTCVVEGCEKNVSHKKSMIQVFL
ncbi:hypothetical protein TW65_00215 [Stemphylium lycopersici]|uniref:RING finger domain protein n=1 Tax=Stemphylium lycopersici TaxID=183478 RepID=A0A364MV84_STELY|nr:hypothetical protein TW65_00215 [Stemphylium lycopersici]RAR04723.1 RING finger domain protein [Stemphylium lycopersici]